MGVKVFLFGNKAAVAIEGIIMRWLNDNRLSHNDIVFITQSESGNGKEKYLTYTVFYKDADGV